MANLTSTPSEDAVIQAEEEDIPPELDEILSEILPSEDPLDDPNFNAIEYINRLFPNGNLKTNIPNTTEQSLSTIDSVVVKVKQRINRTEEEILRSVRNQTNTTTKGKQNLDDAQRAMRELFAKITEIQSKADKSERMVTEICRDIKSLDFAKRNLTNTITALKRCHMLCRYIQNDLLVTFLVTAVDQLNEMCSKRQYREAGHLLEAVNLFIQHFAEHRHIPKIDVTYKTVETIKQTLKKQIYEEFTKYLESPQLHPVHNLADSCVVIDALGGTIKKDFLSWFCARELQDYVKFFRPGEEPSSLDLIERRFSWLKRCWRRFDEQYSKIFPPNWKVSEQISEEFCFLTRQHLTDVLDMSRNTLDVDVLIHAIKKTIEIENELKERYGVQIIEVDTDENVPEEPQEIAEEEESPQSPEMLNPRSAAALREKWKRYQKEKQKEQGENEHKNKKTVEYNKFKGIISSVFDMYMDIYIQKEDQLMKQMVDKIMSEETWTVEEDERTKVLRSSTDLIYYFKTSMKVLNTLTKDQAFYDLHLLFKKYLKQYSIILTDKIPPPDTKLNEKEEKMLCLIVNTAEYCSSTTTSMAEAIKKSIKSKFIEKIDLSAEQADFESVIAKAIKGLVYGLEAKLEPAFLQMTKMPWGSWETVEDQSEYVNQVSTYINQSVPIYHNWLSNSSHFSYFCDYFVLGFVPLLIQNIYKCRKLSEGGAHQLMLDFTAIKSVLLQLPTMAKGGAPNPSSRYARTVQKEMNKAELILKVILASQATIVDTYKALIVEGSETDFQRILELKGLPRAEQKALMEQYSNKGVTSPTLTNNSSSSNIATPTTTSTKTLQLKKLLDVGPLNLFSKDKDKEENK